MQTDSHFLYLIFQFTLHSCLKLTCVLFRQSSTVWSFNSNYEPCLVRTGVTFIKLPTQTLGKFHTDSKSVETSDFESGPGPGHRAEIHVFQLYSR